MAGTMKYFSTCNGFPVQLLAVQHDGSPYTGAPHFSGRCPCCNQIHAATRKVSYARFPSKHRCDDRCLSATGHNCQCACGGKNHGLQA